MKYEEAIEWIHSREKFKVKPGLKRMTWMMERLNHPEQTLNAVHIAGTNGKGSTVSFLRHILQEQKFTVGTFTSPYIERFNERISVNGTPIPDHSLAFLVEIIKPLAEELAQTPLGEPTEFEIITAMAMLHFSELQLDYVLIETGLGGKYDSTNILAPLVSVITNIGHDHMNILGNTVEEIAEEKAGIIKPEVPIITAVKQTEALEVIAHRAKECESALYCLGEAFHVEHLKSTEIGESFIFSNQNYTSPELLSRMKGQHQVENVALAIQTAEQLRAIGANVRREKYIDGIRRTFWPARFEKVRNNPLTIIDGAHNEEGTQALVNTLKRHYDGRNIILVYAALEDKPVSKMINLLSEVIKTAYMTTFDFPRALSAKELADYSSITVTKVVEDEQEAIKQASLNVGKDDVLLITGSLYFISKIRKFFESEELLW
ncbi:bifunctional folylpolyglutamate synthase/dihydrofolate synthase [Halobacillus dabanensis]|nr:folylpolyglutamate synthase/dihydrofolate synthase family protein [Halobacillus dabanensis]